MSTLSHSAVPVHAALLPPQAIDLAELLADLPPDPDDVAWWDQQTRGTATAEPPAPPLLDLVGILSVQASYYRSHGTVFGDWFAGRIDELISTARTTKARTTAEFDAREEAMIDHYHERLKTQGYDEAMGDYLGTDHQRFP